MLAAQLSYDMSVAEDDRNHVNAAAAALGTTAPKAEMRLRLAQLRARMENPEATASALDGLHRQAKILEAALAPEQRCSGLPGVAVTQVRAPEGLRGQATDRSGLLSDPAYWCNVSLPVSFGEHTGSKNWSTVSIDMTDLRAVNRRQVPSPRSKRASFEPKPPLPAFALPDPAAASTFATRAGQGAATVGDARRELAVQLAELLEGGAAALWELGTGGHSAFDARCACVMCRESRRGAVSARTLFVNDAAVIAAAAVTEWGRLLSHGLDAAQVRRWAGRLKRRRNVKPTTAITSRHEAGGVLLADIARLDALDSIERVGWSDKLSGLAMLQAVLQPSAVTRLTVKVAELSNMPRSKHSRKLVETKAKLARAQEVGAEQKQRGDKVRPPVDTVALDALIAMVVGSVCSLVEPVDEEDDEEAAAAGYGAPVGLTWVGEVCVQLPLTAPAHAASASNFKTKAPTTCPLDQMQRILAEILARTDYHELHGVHAPAHVLGALETISLAATTAQTQHGGGKRQAEVRVEPGWFQLSILAARLYPQPHLTTELEDETAAKVAAQKAAAAAKAEAARIAAGGQGRSRRRRCEESGGGHRVRSIEGDTGSEGAGSCCKACGGGEAARVEAAKMEAVREEAAQAEAAKVASDPQLLAALADTGGGRDVNVSIL